uniref:Type III pantothenate kinase n=1 Tax=Gracilinema caldarium TaxID=215591 RepID=A0A7C3IKW5_9SPIR
MPPGAPRVAAELGLAALALEGDVRQSGFAAGGGCVDADYFESVRTPETVAREAAHTAVTLLSAKEPEAGTYPVVVGPGIYDKLPINVVNPYEVGADLVADAMAAYAKCKGACVVVDFGTALTFTIIDAQGTMQGVAIAPGLGTAVNALSRDTAQLPYVQLAVPPAPYGKNTLHAIQAGVVYGYTGLVEYMIARIKEDLQVDLQVIATGGLCDVIAPLTRVFSYVDKDLTLRGLKLIAEHC